MVGRTLIGRFRIDRVLGRGGMATVYAAFDQKTGTPVALKILKRELTRDAMVLKRFAREAKAASHLSHPNVVQVLDWGVDSDEAFIAMELAQGLDLLKALAQERPMRQTRAVLLLAQVCAALSAAHAKGIVHRDLKPENVLVVPDPTEPGGECAKVLDFGIAKMLDQGKQAAGGEDPPSYVTKTALTRVGTIVGTPAYMSPEQCRGGDIDGRSDIYACGVLLYQLITGELPFSGETPLHTAMRHIHAQPRPPSELRRDLDPSFERVILKALAKWPGERQQTAEQLRDELLDTVPGLPDRGDLVLADRKARTDKRAGPVAPPQLSSSGPHPNALQLASEGSTGGRLGVVDPKVVVQPTKGPVPASKPAQEVKRVATDPVQPARNLAAGALGATPLRGVQLAAASPEPKDTSPEGALSAAAVSLMPHTTRPEVEQLPASSVAPARPAEDDDDEPRTFLMRPDEPARAGSSAAKPSATPVAPSKAEAPISPRARLDSTTAKDARSIARTDRAPQRPVIRAKVTQTGLTPTSEHAKPPRPASDPQSPRTGGSAERSPTPPIALGALPPVPTSAEPGGREPGRGGTARGAAAPSAPATPPEAFSSGMYTAAAQAPAPTAATPIDDDEPATAVREPGPTSNAQGRTLVMNESAPSNLAAPLGAPPSALNLSPQGYVDPYAPEDAEALRALKATSRIHEEAAHAERLAQSDAVKATVRMNPQEIARAAPQPPPSSQGPHSPQQPRTLNMDPNTSAQLGYALAPGGWNEPTVVRRRAQVQGPSPATAHGGLVTQLQGLSGTTGLLIGVGLGLGLAAGLLIAFLLLR